MINLLTEKCIACSLCVKACLFSGIRLDGKVPVLTEHCTGCGACVEVCRVGAIVSEGTPAPPPDLGSYRDIWVIAEQQQEGVHPVSFELLGKAIKRSPPLSRYKIRSLKPLSPFDVTAAETLLGWKPSVGVAHFTYDDLIACF